jgi:hypothetical protein
MKTSLTTPNQLTEPNRSAKPQDYSLANSVNPLKVTACMAVTFIPATSNQFYDLPVKALAKQQISVQTSAIHFSNCVNAQASTETTRQYFFRCYFLSPSYKLNQHTRFMCMFMLSFFSKFKIPAVKPTLFFRQM